MFLLKFMILSWRCHDLETLSVFLALWEINTDWWIPLPHKRPEWGDAMFSLMLASRKSCWTNHRFVGNLRRYDVHVTLLKLLVACVEPLWYKTSIVNTVKPGGAYMSVSRGSPFPCHWSRQCGAKPLTESILTCCQLDPQKQLLLKM